MATRVTHSNGWMQPPIMLLCHIRHTKALSVVMKNKTLLILAVALIALVVAVGVPLSLKALKESQKEAARIARDKAAADAERRRSESVMMQQSRAIEMQRAQQRALEEDLRRHPLEVVPGTLSVTTNSIGMTEITGMIHNRTNATIPYAQLNFACVDSSGAQVDTALANITDLQPGADWKFRTLSVAKDVQAVRLVKAVVFPPQ